MQYRIDHAPRGLDAVVAGEKRCVAADRVAQQPLVRRFFAGEGMTGDQLDGVAHHFLARPLDPRPCGDHDLRAQAKAEVVRLRRCDLIEDRHRRALQIDDDLVAVIGRHLPVRI